MKNKRIPAFTGGTTANNRTHETTQPQGNPSKNAFHCRGCGAKTRLCYHCFNVYCPCCDAPHLVNDDWACEEL